MINVAIIGCGYWGPNYIRAFNSNEKSLIKTCCDLDLDRLKKIKDLYADIHLTSNYLEVLNDSSIDAVCISTPASMHYEMTKAALNYGKHVLVEKPFTLSTSHAQELTHLAKTLNKKLFIGHVYLYHPVIQKISSILRDDELGQLYYVYSNRTGLGPIRQDVNAMWDLAPHDISILLHLLNSVPKSVSATGSSYLRNKVEDVVFLTLKFPNNVLCNIHTSWLAPYKIRTFTMVGSEKMLVFDDVNPIEKLRIYDSGASIVKPHPSYDDFIVAVKKGDVSIPLIPWNEPLRMQCNHFIDCIIDDEEPLTNAHKATQVIQILERAQQSLNLHGKETYIN